MATAACLPIAADRAGACVRTIFFEGLDLVGVTLALEMRLNPETPGAAAVALGMGATANAEGLRLIGVTTTNGVPTSQVVLRVNETTLKDAAKVPYSGELGSASSLFYDLIGIFGQDKRRLCYGEFVALPTVYGMDAAPASRPEAYRAIAGAASSWSAARLVFNDDTVTVRIDGADLMGAEVAKAGDFAARAETAKAGAEEAQAAAQFSAGRFIATSALAYGLVVDRAGGGIWDLLQWRTCLYQDIAGTVPVTASGQRVGCFRDALGDASWDLVAPSADARPTFRIVDGIASVFCDVGQGLLTRAVHDVTVPFWLVGAIDRSSNVGYTRMALLSRNVMQHSLVPNDLGAYAAYNDAGGTPKYIGTPFYSSRVATWAVVDTVVRQQQTDIRLNGGAQVEGRSPQAIAINAGAVIPTAIVAINIGEQGLAGQASGTPYTNSTTTFYGGAFITGEPPQAARDGLVRYFRTQIEPEMRATDKVIIIDGDSTGDGVDEATSDIGAELFDRWASEPGQLRAVYPNDTIYYRNYTSRGQQYTGWQRTQIGTSGRRIFVSNASVPGSQPCYHMTARFAAVFGVHPHIDEVITNHGHNMAVNYLAVTGEAGKYLRLGEWLDYFDRVRRAYPNAAHLAIRTHPNGNAGDQSILPVVQALDLAAGYYGDMTLVDIYAYFEANGRPAAWYNDDKVHIREPDGVTAQLTVFGPAYANWQRPAFVAPARIGRTTANLLPNGRFDDFDGALPDGWTKEGAGSVVRSIEQVDAEMGDNYSVKMTGVVDLFRQIDATQYRGQVMIVAVRQFVAGGNSPDRGRVRLFANGTSAIGEGNSQYDSSGQPVNGWRWLYHAVLVPADATTITLKLFGAASGTGTAYYGRAVLTAGSRPKDQR